MFSTKKASSISFLFGKKIARGSFRNLGLGEVELVSKGGHNLIEPLLIVVSHNNDKPQSPNFLTLQFANKIFH